MDTLMIMDILTATPMITVIPMVTHMAVQMAITRFVLNFIFYLII